MSRFIVLLLLLTGGTAVAQPWGPGPPYEPPARYQRPVGRWQELLVRQTAQPGVDVVVFRGKGGRLGLLRITPIGGIDRVVVEYDRRPPQTFRLDRWTRRGPEVVLEVDRGARIRQIVIFSRHAWHGPYAVWGA